MNTHLSVTPGRPGTPGKGPQRGPKTAQVPIRPQAGASGGCGAVANTDFKSQ